MLESAYRKERESFMNTKVKSHEAIRRLAMAAMLSAIAAVLQLIEISIPLMPSFVKLDLSDLPALLGAFSLGPWWGVLIELVKNLLHWPFGSSAGVGELCNFLLGGVFVLTAGLVYARRKSRGTALLGSVLGAVAMALFSLPLNYYLVYPVYTNFMPLESIVSAYEAILGNVAKVPTSNSLFNCLLIFNMPFTLIKGLLNMLVCFFIYKPLSRTVLSKGLLSEEKAGLTAVDLRKKKRNLWILTAVGILLLLVQAFLWAIKLFPETLAFAKPFVKMAAAMDKLLADPGKSWALKALAVLAFHAPGVSGVLCVVLGLVNLTRVKKQQAAKPEESPNPEE